MSQWLRVRFYVNDEACGGDYRPIKWPPVGPYWCSGETDTDFILIAYVRREQEIFEFWPEATKLSCQERDVITFTDRFPKPEWWNNE